MHCTAPGTVYSECGMVRFPGLYALHIFLSSPSLVQVSRLADAHAHAQGKMQAAIHQAGWLG